MRTSAESACVDGVERERGPQAKRHALVRTALLSALRQGMEWPVRECGLDTCREEGKRDASVSGSADSPNMRGAIGGATPAGFPSLHPFRFYSLRSGLMSLP